MREDDGGLENSVYLRFFKKKKPSSFEKEV